MWNLGIFYDFFFAISNASLVVFSLYLGVTKQRKKNIKEIKEEEKILLFFLTG